MASRSSAWRGKGRRCRAGAASIGLPVLEHRARRSRCAPHRGTEARDRTQRRGLAVVREEERCGEAPSGTHDHRVVERGCPPEPRSDAVVPRRPDPTIRARASRGRLLSPCSKGSSAAFGAQPDERRPEWFDHPLGFCQLMLRNALRSSWGGFALDACHDAILDEVERGALRRRVRLGRVADCPRDTSDGPRVVGHRASCGSVLSPMTPLHLHLPYPRGWTAVEPHGASPAPAVLARSTIEPSAALGPAPSPIPSGRPRRGRGMPGSGRRSGHPAASSPLGGVGGIVARSTRAAAWTPAPRRLAGHAG